MEWRILCAIAAGIAGFYAGFGAYGFCNTNFSRTVLVPWGALLAIILGTSAWKLRKEPFGFVMLLATAGFASAVSGLALIAFILD